MRWLAYSDADELLVEHDPREQVDEADVGGEEGHHLGAAQHAQGVDVEVVGQHPQQAEQAAATKKFACGNNWTVMVSAAQSRHCNQ